MPKSSPSPESSIDPAEESKSKLPPQERWTEKLEISLVSLALPQCLHCGSALLDQL